MMKGIYSTLGFLLVVTVLAGSCEKSNSSETIQTPSFDIIQEKILNVSCALSGCHASVSDASFSQHGLVLSPGKSFANLVGILSKNAAAATMGMKRVNPKDPDNSFLMHKIACEAGHHSSSENFGSQMPMGGNFLTRGQVEFIRSWIVNGASATDGSVNVSILDDTTPCQPQIEPLPAPTSGFQMKISPFDIPANFEREIFVRKNTPNTETAYINRIQLRGMSNSHHLVIYSFRNLSLLPTVDVLRDLRNANGSINIDNLQNHIFLGGGTDVNSDYSLPPGVALKFEPGSPVDLNAHYFNKTSYTLKGENYINFYTIPSASVQYVARTLDLNNLEISIPAGERKTFTKNFIFNELTRIALLTSHFHKLGEKFVIKIYGGARNGEVIYTNTDWEHPAFTPYATPIVLQPGEGLTSEVTYYNNTSKNVSFGLTSEDEMNIIFGYYY
ncbi:MAG: hypothetical protein ACO29O_08695 [Chitinophagaceae bacterium]